MAAPFKLVLSEIAAAGACPDGDTHFLLKSGGKDVIEYPNGWQRADSERVARESLRCFLWLVSHRFIPVSAPEARDVVVAVYGDAMDSLHKVVDIPASP